MLLSLAEEILLRAEFKITLDKGFTSTSSVVIGLLFKMTVEEIG